MNISIWVLTDAWRELSQRSNQKFYGLALTSTTRLNENTSPSWLFKMEMSCGNVLELCTTRCPDWRGEQTFHRPKPMDVLYHFESSANSANNGRVDSSYLTLIPSGLSFHPSGTNIILNMRQIDLDEQISRCTWLYCYGSIAQMNVDSGIHPRKWLPEDLLGLIFQQNTLGPPRQQNTQLSVNP